MTFDQIWGQFTKKRPELNTDEATVEFTAASLRLLLRQVYEQGQASVHKPSPAQDAFRNAFGGMFR